MTTFRVVMETKDYRIRQELQQAVLSQGELMYRYGFDGDAFQFETERELTLQQGMCLIPSEFREYVGRMDIIQPIYQQRDLKADPFQSAYELYHKG